MKKTILVAIILILTVGSFTYEVFQYDRRPKPAPTTVSIQKYNELSKTLADHDATAASEKLTGESKTNTLITQRNTLCAQIKTAKLAVNPALCQ